MSKKRLKRIYLEITNYCNLSCSFCPQDNRPKKFISLEEIKQILPKLVDYTDYLYLHVQGEPLLHPNLLAILDLCHQYQFKVQLVTNGTLLNNYDSSLFQHPALRKLSVSLHSIDQHNMDINEYMKPLFHLKDYPTLYKELRFWNSQAISSSKRSLELINYLKEQFIINTLGLSLGRGQVISENYFLAFDKQFQWPELTETTYQVGTCYGTRDMLAILVDGTIVPCCLDHTGTISFGNLFEIELSDVLQNKRYQTMKSGFQNNKVVEELCKHCEYRTRFIKKATE